MSRIQSNLYYFCTAVLILIGVANVSVAAPIRDASCENGSFRLPPGDPDWSDAGYSGKGYCYLKLAKKTKNIGYCASIPERALDAVCIRALSVIKKDYKTCYDLKRQGNDILEGAYESDCLQTYAYVFDDASVCKLLKPGHARECFESLKYKSEHSASKRKGSE